MGGGLNKEGGPIVFISAIQIKTGFTRYYLKEPDGTERAAIVAWYDSLEEAALVLRYLKGAWMSSEDQKAALRLIRKWDTRKETSE